MHGKTIEELNVGDRASFSKTIAEADVYLFAGITGDFNPVHIDETYARTTVFTTRIAHGMLIAGFFSTLLGTRLPGPGSIYLSQSLNFLAPVAIGDTIVASVEVIDILTGKKRVLMKTTCINQHGTVVMDGEALVSPPRGNRSAG